MDLTRLDGIKRLVFPCVAAAFISSCDGTPVGPAAARPAPGAPGAPSPRDVSPDEAEKLLGEDPRVVVLDVRTPAEFAAGHLRGARNFDVNGPAFKDQVSSLDRTKPYLVHCAAGKRSALAVEVLKGLDFPSIYHMGAGMNGWLKAGKPVEK